MQHLPAFIDVKGRPVLVVGGGTQAARRTALALKAGAEVCVVARQLCSAFEELSEIKHTSRDFEEGDLSDAVVVFSASEEEDENTRVATLATQRGIPVNAVDRLDVSTFIVPSIIDRDPLTIAISSGGLSPVSARQLRADLESSIPVGAGELARFSGDHRERVMKIITDPEERRRFWEDLGEGPIGELVRNGRISEAEKLLDEQLNSGRSPLMGEVYLVGSGPGDPDLLTFRALRLMQRADVVLHDRLVSDEILELVRREADFFFVGKQRSDHAVPQQEISQMLVEQAKLGKRVLRLKGGDPFTFGRGGEEMELLAQEGVPFQVVPGITAANGCAAYTGIPLTHRDHAQACVFVTGHTKDGKLDLNWQTLTPPNQTVVVYMGLHSMAELTGSLIAHGADPKVPVAVIENGTRKNQKVVIGKLDNITQLVEHSDLKGPAMIIIGTVVSLRDLLAHEA